MDTDAYLVRSWGFVLLSTPLLQLVLIEFGLVGVRVTGWLTGTARVLLEVGASLRPALIAEHRWASEAGIDDVHRELLRGNGLFLGDCDD